MSMNLKIRSIDPIKAIELLAATIEIGFGLHKLYKYLMTHPVSLEIPSFLYEVDYTWYDKLSSTCIFYCSKKTTVLGIFKIQEDDQIIIGSHVPENLENARSRTTHLWIGRRHIKTFYH